jgi:hypothetical protein
MLPVLVMTLGFSRCLTATRLPSRQAGDWLAGMWQLINALGKVPKTLIWDRESAIGGKGVVTVPAASFAGTLATRIQLAPPRDPEFKGLMERNNGNIETSFLCRDGRSRRRRSSTRSLPAGCRRPTGAWCVPPDAGPTRPWTLIWGYRTKRVYGRGMLPCNGGRNQG